MSSATISGADSLDIICQIAKRDLKKMNPGEIRYALSYHQSGYARSDLTIWKQDQNKYILMSGLPNDISELLSFKDSGVDCKIQNLSKIVNIYSVQGPNSLHVLSNFLNGEILKKLPYFRFLESNILNTPCLIGRLGYTGELGFEIILPTEHKLIIWEQLSSRIAPCGLVAINQLRIEAGFVFFDNEFRLPVTAKDLGLGKFSNNYAERQNLRLISFESNTNQKLELWSPIKNLKVPEVGDIIITSACKQSNSSKCLGLGFVKISDTVYRQEYRDPYENFWDIKEVPRPFYDTLKQRPRVKLV